MYSINTRCVSKSNRTPQTSELHPRLEAIRMQAQASKCAGNVPIARGHAVVPILRLFVPAVAAVAAAPRIQGPSTSALGTVLL